jgi:hypothetical protein
VSGALLGVLVFVLVASTGLAVAASLRLDSLGKLLLAAYVIAFAEIVALVLLLSPIGAVQRPVLLVGLAVVSAVAIGLWWREGRPRPHGATVRRAWTLLEQSPPAALLGLVVAAALGYVVALIVGTPPNNWDSMTYHLARAAFWRQNESVGYLADAYDGRLNANPTSSESVLTFVLELTREERLAGFLQFSAAIICLLAVFILARRLGLSEREAAFGGLLFLTLPLVVLQASTTQNDLVVASLLLGATVFIVGDTRRELGLASLATALAVGVKVTAFYGLPILLAVGLVAIPRGARLGRIVAVVAGAVVGSYWYLVNLLETSKPLGRRPDTELLAVLRPEENLLAAVARILDAFDLSGSEDARASVLSNLFSTDLVLYVVVAAAMTTAMLLASILTRRVGIRAALLAGALAVVPLAIPPISYVVWRGFAKLHDVLGASDGSLPAGEWPPQTTASESFSWFGPLGLVLVTGVGVATAILVRRRSLSVLALLLAAAPLIWLVLVSVTIAYDTWQGRFFVFPVALSASLWGILLRRPPVAWACVAVGATTVALVFVNSLEKPSGVQLFADTSATSVWRSERWEVQSSGRPEMSPVLWFLEERVPKEDAVALALGEDDFGYPAFGPHLERQVELVREGSRGRGVRATWLVANPRRSPDIDTACWRVALDAPGRWKVFRRALAPCPP